MTGPRDQAAKAEPVQHGADAALRQHHAEPGLDRSREIGPAPADHAVLGQVRATADPLGDLALLLGRQQSLRGCLETPSL